VLISDNCTLHTISLSGNHAYPKLLYNTHTWTKKYIRIKRPTRQSVKATQWERYDSMSVHNVAWLVKESCRTELLRLLPVIRVHVCTVQVHQYLVHVHTYTSIASVSTTGKLTMHAWRIIVYLYHRLNGSSSHVLTATSHSYGKAKNSTPPTESKPLIWLR